jgi:alkanesulfonate monooxygenase SsuD/methylene tetrahydromethanopterin reductase-like flavin-dependent oxidoreductase (luciferase family)
VYFAIDLPISGDFSDPRLLAELARLAEDAGWDGCFVWDHLQVETGSPVADPWITLSAIAVTTERIRIGPLVTPLFRRHPWKVARESVTLDHLSGGRLILGVGIGSDIFGEIGAIDGPRDASTRAEMLDESLAIITGLWSGDRFSFSGKYYRVGQVHFLPRPLQMPRIPIWVAGTWPKKPPFRRAARYDGVVPVAGDLKTSIAPAQVRELIEYVGRFRTEGRHFDVAQFGATSDNSKTDVETVTSYAQAGVTWWLETIAPGRHSLADARKRISLGPTKIQPPPG